VIDFPDPRRAFGEASLEASVYTYLHALMDTLGPQLHTVSLVSVADALGWSHDKELRNVIVRALEELTFGEPSLFERHFFLWPEKQDSEVLEQPLAQVSDLEMRRALETNQLVVIETGEVVKDFVSRISVEYVVRDDVSKQLHAHQENQS
jgi:hypothetical protein